MRQWRYLVDSQEDGNALGLRQGLLVAQLVGDHLDQEPHHRVAIPHLLAVDDEDLAVADDLADVQGVGVAQDLVDVGPGQATDLVVGGGGALDEGGGRLAEVGMELQIGGGDGVHVGPALQHLLDQRLPPLDRPVGGRQPLAEVVEGRADPERDRRRQRGQVGVRQQVERGGEDLRLVVLGPGDVDHPLIDDVDDRVEVRPPETRKGSIPHSGAWKSR